MLWCSNVQRIVLYLFYKRGCLSLLRTTPFRRAKTNLGKPNTSQKEFSSMMSFTHMKVANIIFGTSLLIFKISSVAGHSFLVKPRGDFNTFKKPECRWGGPPHSPNDTCHGPCIEKASWQFGKHTFNNTYSRGQQVSFSWTKNNHRGGFISFSLVPKHLRMDKTAHRKMTFRYACFESDPYPCDLLPKLNCGTDSLLYRTKVTIPTSLRDGEYVLGWTWFGGLQRHSVSYFGDYYSCTPVTITGGPLTQTYAPMFIPGENTKSSTTCLSAVDRLGVCLREPCHGFGAKNMKPFPFSVNQTPEPIRLSVEVIGLQLVDTDTNNVLETEFGKDVYIPANVSGISFMAMVRGDATRVSFYMNNDWVGTETHAPFAMFGDIGTTPRPWSRPILGRWIAVKIVAFTGDGSYNQKTFWVRLYQSKA